MDYRPDDVGPLNDMRIVDVSRLVAGNMLTCVLGDLGADVIKVEEPGRGDPLRDWRVKGISVYWKIYGRNKRSITLNLRRPEGREILLQLLERADVFVENFRPGKLEKLGLAPEILLDRNPGLVVVRISGWGQSGPYAQRPGYGTLVEAMSGFAALNGYDDRPPVLPPLALADMVAGLYGAVAALTAVRYRDASGGKGQVIDLALFDPLFSLLSVEAGIYQLTGKVKARTGSRSNSSAPRNVYKTRDGRWLALSASMQIMAERLFRSMGREDLIEDPRFRTNADRLANVEELDAIVQSFIAQRTLAENLDFFERAGVTVAPVYDISQILKDPHFLSRQVIVEMPDKETGRFPMHNIVPRFSVSPGALRLPAPVLGEHNRQVLGALGFEAAEIDRLAREGVI
ncbi:MAG: CoA transferase [Firmicutes bacterium]|nr:CoA transferase [Bacillota bacterium]